MSDEQEREREGLAMIYAGLKQGLAWMPDGCDTARSFGPLVPEVERRLEVFREFLERHGRPI
jgi:hypothetical protein